MNEKNIKNIVYTIAYKKDCNQITVFFGASDLNRTDDLLIHATTTFVAT